MYHQHDSDEEYVTQYSSDNYSQTDNRIDLANYDNTTFRHVNGNGQGSQDDMKILTFDEWLTKCCSVVEESWFKGVTLFLVIINTLLLGIATMDFVTDYSPMWIVFHRIDMFFVGLFTIELLMLIKHRGLRQFDMWQIFDATLILSTWIFLTEPQLQDFPVLRALRLVVK